MIPPFDSKSSRFSPQPHWKTATRTPYAAATESRFRTIAFSATTIERNEISISRNANSSTNPKTRGIDVFIAADESLSIAVVPVTAYSTPSTWPTVAGSSSSRRVSSAA